MNKKIGYSILATLVLGSLFAVLQTESQVPYVTPSVQISPLPVDTALRDKTNAANYVVIDSSGALKVAIGGSSSSVVTVTNADITTLLALMQSVHNTNNATARTNHLRTLNLIGVSNTVPTAVATGTGVAGWADELGRQVIKGTDLTSDSIKANVINQPEDQMLGGDGTWVPLSLVTNTQSSVWFDVSGYKYFSYFIIPAAATNHVITCEVSPNSGTNWVGIYTNTITSTNNICVSFGPIAHKYMRWSYTGTNETCSVNVVAKK